MTVKWQSAAWVDVGGVPTWPLFPTTGTEVLLQAAVAVTWYDVSPAMRVFVITGLPTAPCEDAGLIQAAFPGVTCKWVAYGGVDKWPLVPGSPDPPYTDLCKP
jgi:hypothetical protein